MTAADWADRLAHFLDDALDALDPDAEAPELHDHRAALHQFCAWRLEQQGQIRIPLTEDYAA